MKFTAKSATLLAMTKAPIVAKRFQNATVLPISSNHTQVRRGMPWRPSQCIGANVMFIPMNIIQNWILPIRSLIIRPVNNGK